MAVQPQVGHFGHLAKKNFLLTLFQRNDSKGPKWLIVFKNKIFSFYIFKSYWPFWTLKAIPLVQSRKKFFFSREAKMADSSWGSKVFMPL